MEFLHFLSLISLKNTSIILSKDIINMKKDEKKTLKVLSQLWYGYKKYLHDPHNHDGVITHLEPDIRECEVKWAFSSLTQLSPTLYEPINRSMPGLPVHHQLLEFTQTHVHRVSDAIQPSHPLLSPSTPAPNPPQHQSLFQWVNSSHEVAKVLEL